MVQFNNLRLSGFKSFVDPTDLIIQDGVTGVVGPNGCGKSNLVEALRWVMGENSAKRMRGGEMDDVIFAGSASRPSRNVADVTLMLDNSARTAPAMFNDYDELEVVRRITRGQGSNYRVNGREVRARDVQLLFADSATGAHSTALVSQGRVGALINAKPTDRRSLLEEAAGITGLHSRRHEAELRLRAAETNLERLDDVITTLEAQLQSLKKQARQATRYRNINGHIRRHEAIGLHLEAEDRKVALAQAREALATAEQNVARLTEASAASATAQAEAAAVLPDLRQAEAEAAAALHRLVVDRDQLDREEARAAAAKEQAEERLRQLESDRARAKALVDDAAAARQRMDEERDALQAAAEGESDARETAGAERETAAEDVSHFETRLGELTAQVAADEARSAALERRNRELTERQTRLNEQLERMRGQIAELSAERERNEELKALEAELESAEAALESCRASSDAAEQALSTTRETEADAREIRQQAEAERSRLEAEAGALRAILEPGEPDMWPPVVDRVTVEPGYETALGAALGDDLTASSDEAAPVHWETLPPYSPAPDLPPGARPLSGLVEGPSALTRRLSQIGVVEDEAAGRRLQGDLKPGQRLVTREGALWRWDGFAAQADAPTGAAVRLAQRNRLIELGDLLDGAGRQANEAAASHEEKQVAAESAATAERAARAAVHEAFGKVNQTRQRQANLVQSFAALGSRLTGLEETAERLTADLSETEAQLGATREELAQMPPLDGERLKITELRSELAERRSRLAECQSAVDRLTRDAEARSERLAAIERDKALWASRSADAERHMGELDQRQSDTAEEVARLAAVPGELGARREALAGSIEAAEAKRKAAADALASGESRLAEADRKLKSEEAQTATAREDRVRAESAVEQCQQGLESVTEKVREKLDCALDQVMEVGEIDPEQALPTRDEVEAKLTRLLRERENIGPVNLRAEVEARELGDQIDGMQTERSDLVTAIARLRQGIGSLNREGRERLLAAFEQVNGHFTELFVRLFGGGRAHLKLTEADDPLDAGLEIMASPPGKRLQIMSLLSGGEQALTALSLLFAVFLTNPAPICVLDEVDAPLDDANVDRFCSLVDELTESTSTRFLVITHHRMTMARVDRLFGVTMGERGVSQLVSVDLDAAERLRDTA